MMKKLIKPAIFILISLAVFFILRSAFPKYQGTLNFFLIYLWLIAYLWSWTKKRFIKIRPVFRYFLTILFWLPFILLIFLIAYGFFIPFMQWNMLLRTYAFSIFFITILCTMFPILGLIVADVVLAANKMRSIVFPSRNLRDKKVGRIHKIVIGGWIFGGAIALVLIAGMIFWVYDFRVKEQTIVMKELPPGFDGLRIVHFSDIHLGSWAKKVKLQEAVSMIMAIRPDLIVFTGDMFNWSTSEGEGFQEILKQVHAPLGVFAILGNHDYGDYMMWPSDTAKQKNMDDLSLFYKSLNWNLLRNEHATIRKNNDSLVLIGVENWGATKRFQRHGDIKKALLGTEGMSFFILLSHDPTHWNQVIIKNHPEIDLTLSGHTHGGQFGIDAPWLHWSPVTLTSKEWCGLYTRNYGKTVQHLYVNQGLGNIGYAGRVGILPEITLLILKKRK